MILQFIAINPKKNRPERKCRTSDVATRPRPCPPGTTLTAAIFPPPIDEEGEGRGQSVRRMCAATDTETVISNALSIQNFCEQKARKGQEMKTVQAMTRLGMTRLVVDRP